MVTLCETLLRLTAGGVWLQVAKVVIPEVLIGEVNFGYTITDSEDIEYIVANIQGISMKRDGISLGRSGYSFKISYINSNDKNIIPVFILNSDNIIRKDPFYYRCDGGLCFDYLKACEEKYRTNVTESIEEK